MGLNVLVLDTEHTASVFHAYEDGFFLTCCGMVDNQGDEEIVWFDHYEAEPTVRGLERVQARIDGADVIVAHNAKHDVNVLRAYGIDFGDKVLHCTQVSEYILSGQDKNRTFSLNEVAKHYGFDQKMDEVKALWDAGVDTHDIPSHLLGSYCLKDCTLTMQIYDIQTKLIEKSNMTKVVALQNEFIYSLSEMESNGFRLDVARAEEIIVEYKQKADDYQDIVREMCHEPRINLGSAQQRSAILFGGLLKLSWREWVITELKTKPYSYYKEQTKEERYEFKGLGFVPDPKDLGADGYYSVKKDKIEALKARTKEMREIKRIIVEFARCAKVHETLRGKSGETGLLNKVQPDGLIHAKLNQTIASTGRLTSSDPNGQNLPRGGTSPIKLCIVPTLDGIMQVDLSQIEWRAAAWLSQDPVMMEEINSGIDQHIATVRELMEQEFISKDDPKSKERRNHAKVFNFRMIYGGGPWGFFLDINMPSFTFKKWKLIIKAFFAKYKGLKSYHDDCIRFVLTHGYLRLPTGRWFKFHKNGLQDGVKVYKVNQIKNFPVQGMSGGDFLPLMCVIIRRGMRQLGMKSKLMLTVHDSVVFDYAEGEKDRLAKLCYDVGNNLDKYIKAYFGIDWNVKLAVEVEAGDSYGDLKYIAPEAVTK